MIEFGTLAARNILVNTRENGYRNNSKTSKGSLSFNSVSILLFNIMHESYF